MGIYIWGTGCGASEVLEAGLPLEKISGFVDNFPFSDTFLGKPVLRPEALDVDGCDLLIVTPRASAAIREKCLQVGIPLDKCLFLKNHLSLTDWNDGCPNAERILGPDLLAKLIPQSRVIPVPGQLRNSQLPQRDLENDYVRLATLELLCRRVEALPGACAELGVYKGFFARCINGLLPEKKLYLFDSFQGFAPGTASEAFQAAHENTAIEKVLALLPHREMAEVRPGFFPGSLHGLEEAFCLVSLDVDFYETTLEGLRYFWPQLVAGGVLLLHDWGNQKLPGVKQAVADYERELGRTLPAVPVADVMGTLVVCK